MERIFGLEQLTISAFSEVANTLSDDIIALLLILAAIVVVYFIKRLKKIEVRRKSFSVKAEMKNSENSSRYFKDGHEANKLNSHEQQEEPMER